MSETLQPVKVSTVSPVAAPQALVDAYIFDSDVQEVFLLIDHISGRSEKSLKDLDAEGVELPIAPEVAASAGQGGAVDGKGNLVALKPSVADVLHSLCQIGYPPNPDPMTKARKAAFVLATKDRLNALAAPARGITVAYTAMFVSATDRCALLRSRNVNQPDPRRSARSDLARQAYPILDGHARCFSKMFRQFLTLMLIVLPLTASAYWDVGFGRSLVQHMEQLYKQKNALLHPSGPGGAAVATVAESMCSGNRAALPVTQLQVCDGLDSVQKQLKAAREALHNFAVAATTGEAGGWFVRTVNWLRPIHYGFILTGQVLPPDSAVGTEASVTWLLVLFSTYVLPGMFGLLGTLAAITRGIQAKVRDSLLGPRDLPLSVLGLIAGPIAGLAVGLFYMPSGAEAAGPVGGAGAVSLSASGLGFVAGYGADAFFRFVDALLERIFALQAASK